MLVGERRLGGGEEVKGRGWEKVDCFIMKYKTEKVWMSLKRRIRTKRDKRTKKSTVYVISEKRAVCVILKILGKKIKYSYQDIYP